MDKNGLKIEKPWKYNAGYNLDIKGYNFEDETIHKTGNEMVEWLNKLVNKEPYKYVVFIYDKNIEEPIGEVYFYYDESSKTNNAGNLINSRYRGRGYSYDALSELERVAFEKYGLNELSDYIPVDRTNAIKSFQKAGFIQYV